MGVGVEWYFRNEWKRYCYHPHFRCGTGLLKSRPFLHNNLDWSCYTDMVSYVRTTLWIVYELFGRVRVCYMCVYSECLITRPCRKSEWNLKYTGVWIISWERGDGKHYLHCLCCTVVGDFGLYIHVSAEWFFDRVRRRDCDVLLYVRCLLCIDMKYRYVPV